MTPKRVEPSIQSVSFSCPHCDALSHHTWYELLASRIEGSGRVPAPDPQVALARVLSAFNKQGGVPSVIPNIYQIQIGPESTRSLNCSAASNLNLSLCYACGKLAVWVGERIVYPPVRHGADPNADLPADVLQDYEEARSIIELSPRGAAALLRLCIQKLCKHAGESGININGDISNLVKKGLDKRVQQALDIVRVIGNESVHPGQIDLRDDRATAAELFALVNLVADKMLSEPKRIDQMYRSCPK
jgi:hypothetical protein